MIRRFFKWLWGKLFPGPPTANDVIDNYVVVRYRGVHITMRRAEKMAWDIMSRKEKNAIWESNKRALKKGRVKYTQVEGKTITIRK